MTTTGNHDTRLGSKFRAIRKERGLSLAEVARETEISSSFLSLFENDGSDITFSRLARLVRFYDVSITDLIPDPEPTESIVVRRELRRRLNSPQEGAELFILAHEFTHRMMPYIIAAEPGAEPIETTLIPGSEIFLLVLGGTIEVDSDAEATIQLRKGDAVYLADDRIRTIGTVGRHASEILVVRAPPPAAFSPGNRRS
jgi:transcriptional regulator with XRE-family HTH domain